MEGFRRNLKLSVMWMKRLCLYSYIAPLVLTLWFMILEDSLVNSIYEFVVAFLLLSVVMGVTYIFIYMAMNTAVILPQAVAYGSTRKCAAIGMMATNLMFSAVSLIINAVIYVASTIVFHESFMAAVDVLFVINLYLCVTAIAPLAGIMVLKFGKIGYFIVTFTACALLGGSVGFFMGSVTTGDDAEFSGIAHGVFTLPINVTVMAAAIVCLILIGWFFVWTTRKLEVKM